MGSAESCPIRSSFTRLTERAGPSPGFDGESWSQTLSVLQAMSADPDVRVSDQDRRFAVLEHRWNGVHWDFLVEDGDSLRTWAIDAVIADGIDLAARALPAHRRIYLDYEGPISGGRGEVRRWDSGRAGVEIWTDSVVRLRLTGSQLVGVIEFREEGGITAADAPRRWLCRFGKFS